MFETLKVVVEDAILPHDKDLILSVVESIVELINQNPFTSRIWFLLLNPEIAQKPVINKKSELKPPNCIGTALFVAGLDQIGYPYHAYDDELGDHTGEFDPENLQGRLFSSYRRYPERMIPGAFCFSYSEDADCHAGIYLGQVKGEHILFAQHGAGGVFCVETLSGNYTSPDFYIPATLQNR
ncbi:MAG: hypothetical protein WC027_01075 [Candidatus Paceibacterota bacterium]